MNHFMSTQSKSTLWTLLAGMAAISLLSCSKDEGGAQISPHVRGKISITYDGQLVPLIEAKSLEDAFFAQGYLHGSRHGKNISMALQTFKGKPDGLDENLALMSTFFKTLPLEQVAAESLKLHNSRVQNAMKSFLNGLKTGYPDYEWQLSDLLVLQRGYAFLLNDVFAQAWFVYSENVTTTPGAQNPFAVPADFLPLFHGPFLEMVRTNKTLPYTLEFRAGPAWWFVFRPVRITTPEVKAEGMGLAGLPFIWSGANQDIQFIQTPIPGQSAFIFEMDRDKAELVDAITEPVVLSDLVQRGVPVNALAAEETRNSVPRFYWTGFRPSSELQTLFDLLTASSLEKASYCHEFFQTPFCEVLIDTPRFSPLVKHVGTTGLDRPKALSSRYAFPFAGNATNSQAVIPGVQSFSFSSESMGTDEALANLIRQWLSGPLKILMTHSDWVKTQKLFEPDNPLQQVAVQMLWRELLAGSKQHWSTAFTINRPLEVRKAILNEYDRSRNMDIDAESAERINRLSLILSGLVMETGNDPQSSSLLAFYLPDNPETFFHLPQGMAPSLDNPKGLFFSGFQSEIIQATTHEVQISPIGDAPLPIRSFPFAVTGKPTDPKGPYWKPWPALTFEPKADPRNPGK